MPSSASFYKKIHKFLVGFELKNVSNNFLFSVKLPETTLSIHLRTGY